MKRDLVILALMAVFALVAVPTSSAVNAQDRGHGRHSQARGDRDWNVRDRERSDNGWKRRDRDRDDNVWNRKHRKDTHGYRNYGQYRSTQVGNRRSHYVRRYYVSNGTRLSRLVRVFY